LRAGKGARLMAANPHRQAGTEAERDADIAGKDREGGG
jgi:hypothetical protein